MYYTAPSMTRHPTKVAKRGAWRPAMASRFQRLSKSINLAKNRGRPFLRTGWTVYKECPFLEINESLLATSQRLPLPSHLLTPCLWASGPVRPQPQHQQQATICHTLLKFLKSIISLISYALYLFYRWTNWYSERFSSLPNTIPWQVIKFRF